MSRMGFMGSKDQVHSTCQTFAIAAEFRNARFHGARRKSRPRRVPLTGGQRGSLWHAFSTTFAARCWYTRAVNRLSRPRGLFFLAIATALVAFGCSSKDGASASGGAEPARCKTKLDECLTSQMRCVAAEGGAESCQPCPAGQFAGSDGTCAAIGGKAKSYTFPTQTAQSGQEILGTCRSWTLVNDDDLWVNAVELEQNEASHHSNWTFVPEAKFPGPDGIWKCKERGYDQLSAAVAGGVLYAQSTQAAKEVQKFPPGVVVRIPARSRIISDIHILNTTSKPITGAAKLTLYTLDKSAVTVKLTPFHMSYDGLDLPAHAESRFAGECELESYYQQQTKKPIDLKIYYLVPHTHALGTRMFVEVAGGPAAGKSLLDVRGTPGEARGRAFDPPYSLTGAKGLAFGCEFTNPRAENVKWGFGDQEMCETLGFAATPIAFESRIDSAAPNGSDGKIAKFTGPCLTVALAWDK